MLYFFQGFNPIFQSLLAGTFSFLITALGSAVVLFVHKAKKSFMDSMLSISSGIMLSAAFFSLLNPAIQIAKDFSRYTWQTIILGFLIGCIMIQIGDSVFDKTVSHKKNRKKSFLLFSSITLHNIPEGLVIGVAFGAVPFSHNPLDSLVSAIALSIGIAIQNFPEGSAISLPLKGEGLSSIKAFLLGSFSAIVEPIFAVIGAILVLKIKRILPFIMSFAAGAMIYVVIQELIPEIMHNKRKDYMSFLVMIGFSIMMLLEIILS